MTFNSISFAIFLPVLLVLYYAVYRRQPLRDILLLAASYIFYMCWYWQYAGLIVLSTIVDYALGVKMDKERSKRKKRLYLIMSLTVNLGLLAIFKYYNFFADSAFSTLGLFGVEIPHTYSSLLLPVGISFYTFQTLSYSIDVYRGDIPHERSLIKFSVFVSFFPQLVAGPIVRARDFLPQINRPTHLKASDVERGTMLVFIGLFKKIIIADLLAFLIVDEVFSAPGNYSSTDLLISLYAYAFQIYCDFSGYSDIAIGIALLLGFRLPINFNRPYLSQNPSEFWRRWHISLSQWLRDYLYISLGGNRGGRWFTTRNLLITMLLGGLWHGAAWNFILWGAYHGLILVLFRNMITEKKFGFKMVTKIVFNFHLILFSWLIFRVSNMEVFLEYIGGLFALNFKSNTNSIVFFILAIAALSHFIPTSTSNKMKEYFCSSLNGFVRAGLYAGLLLLFIGSSIGEPTFIYFQF